MSTSGPTSPHSVQSRALNCPSCGAPLSVRSFEQAVTVVCGSCNSIIDAKDPGLKILQQFKAATDEDKPLVPLGSRGTLRGTKYEVIGFQRRTIRVEDVPYSWHEYLLFNPFKGFRYLTEYSGHWNDVSTLKGLPEVLGSKVKYLGQTYRHFQTANAATTFVLGEFPWQVRVDERAEVSDYVAPPRALSCERTKDEVTWSLGEYINGKDVWKAFSLAGEPPPRIGVYENQPSPLNASTKAIWRSFCILAAGVLAVFIFFAVSAENRQLFSANYRFDPSGSPQRENSFVTPVFDVDGRTSDIEITTKAAVSNTWIYLNYALISDDTGQAYDFGREVSFYSGRDSDGPWTEGADHDTAAVPAVPPGRYYLRIEPESQRGFKPINYTITVKRDVPQLGIFGLALVALLVPAVAVTWRTINFEHRRWAESD